MKWNTSVELGYKIMVIECDQRVDLAISEMIAPGWANDLDLIYTFESQRLYNENGWTQILLTHRYRIQNRYLPPKVFNCRLKSPYRLHMSTGQWRSLLRLRSRLITGYSLHPTSALSDPHFVSKLFCSTFPHIITSLKPPHILPYHDCALQQWSTSTLPLKTLSIDRHDG